MTRTVILIPFRGDADGWRDAAFRVVHRQATSLGHDVYVGDSRDEPFTVGRTWNHLSDLADADGHWDVAVRWAADCLIARTDSIEAAIAGVTHYTRPFTTGLRLTSAETYTVWAGGPLPPRRDRPMFGGISVNTRTMWDTVGGFDPAFEGWGHEDRAFIHGVRVNFGEPHSVPGRVIQLWHPRRRKGPDSDADPYFGCREANHARYQQIRTIKTPEQWATYVATRNM